MIITGHAFVLLTVEDLQKVFENVIRCLAPIGQFVFESRNPDFDWATCWDYTLDLQLGDQRVTESRRLLSFHDQIMRFELTYQFPGERLRSLSELRFWSQAEIQALLSQAGLKTAKCLGDWPGAPIDPVHSQEMIFHVGNA